MSFGGNTYVAKRDKSRLTKQLDTVRNYMCQNRGVWFTLDALNTLIPEAHQTSISARVRDLRKNQFGGYTIERRYAGGGLFEYRLL
jgi:hypothetical protein